MDPDTNSSINTETPAPVTAPTAAVEVPTVPEGTWPGAFGIYKNSKAAVKFNLSTIILLEVVSFMVRIGLGFINHIWANVLSGVVSLVFIVGLYVVYVASVKRQRLGLQQTLRRAIDLKLVLNMFILTVLLSVSIMLGLLLLIVPGLILIGRLSVAQYFVVDQNMSALDAYKASWHVMKGNTMKAWGIIGATLAMALLMITIIGIPFSIYFVIMYSAATAVLYEFVIKNQPELAAVAASPASEPAQPITNPEPPIQAPPTV